MRLIQFARHTSLSEVSGLALVSATWNIISMGWCKEDRTPLLTHWSYVFLALTHRYEEQPAFSYSRPSHVYLQHSTQPSLVQEVACCLFGAKLLSKVLPVFINIHSIDTRKWIRISQPSITDLWSGPHIPWESSGYTYISFSERWI